MKNKFLIFALSLFAIVFSSSCSNNNKVNDDKKRPILSSTANYVTTNISCENCEVKGYNSNVYSVEYNRKLPVRSEAYEFQFSFVEGEFKKEYPQIISFCIDGVEHASDNTNNQYFTYEKNTGLLEFTLSEDWASIEVYAAISPLACEITYEFNPLAKIYNQTVEDQSFAMKYDGSIDYIDWGDGVIQPGVNLTEPIVSHTYSIDDYSSRASYIYKIKVYGNVFSISFYNGYSREYGVFRSTFSIFNSFENQDVMYAYNVKEIKLKDTITSLKEYAFMDLNGLRLIELPKTLTNVSPKAFNRCDATVKISIDKANPKYDSRDNCSAIIETATNKLVSGTLFSTIPESVTTIGDYAFAETELCSIYIPNSVTRIDDYAFYKCHQLDAIDFTDIKNHKISISPTAFLEFSPNYYGHCSGKAFIVPDSNLDSVSNQLVIESITDSSNSNNHYTDYVYNYTDDNDCGYLLMSFDLNIYPSFVCDSSLCAYENQRFYINYTYELFDTNDGRVFASFGNGDGDKINGNLSYSATNYDNYYENYNQPLPSSGSGYNHFCVKVFANYINDTPNGLPDLLGENSFNPYMVDHLINKISYYTSPAETSYYDNPEDLNIRTSYSSYNNLIFFKPNYRTRSIDRNVFSYCNNLRYFKFNPLLLEIAEKAFYHCDSLNEVIIDSVSIIFGDYSFYKCNSLKKLEIDNLQPHAPKCVIGSYAFAYCDLRELSISCLFGELGINAFAYNEDLASLEFENVDELGDKAQLIIPAFCFDHCTALKNIYIPKFVIFGESFVEQENTDQENYFCYNPFTYCSSLESIIVDASHELYTSNYDGMNLNFVLDKNILEKNENFFILLGTNGAASVSTRFDSVIAPYAFAGMSKLKYFNMRDYCYTRLGYHCFADCTSLTNVDLHDLPIGDSIFSKAFTGCASLRANFDLSTANPNEDNYAEYVKGIQRIDHLCLPANVVLNASCFEGTIISPNGLEIEDNNRLYCENNTVISIPEYDWEPIVLGIGNKQHCYIPEGINRIAEYAFAGGVFDEIYIPASVNEIDPTAFKNCRNVKKITVDPNNEVFSSTDSNGNECNCIFASSGDGLVVVKGCENSILPSNVFRFEDYSFDGTNIKEIDLSNNYSCDTIMFGSYSFSNCKNLRRIITPKIPSSIYPSQDGYTGSILFDDYTFTGCVNLTEIDLSGLASTNFDECFKFNETTFSDYNKSLKVYVNVDLFASIIDQKLKGNDILFFNNVICVYNHKI